MRLKQIGLVACLALFAACHHDKSDNSSGFELSGKLSGGGVGMTIYLERLDPDASVHLDSTRLDNDGKFSFHTKGIFKGFYTIKFTKTDFAMLILDSTEKAHVEGDAQNLGYTYTVTGSPDTKLVIEENTFSRYNYARRDSLEKLFEALLNASGKSKARMDSLNKAAEGPYNALVAQQVSYLTKFIRDNITSFAALVAIEQLDPDKFLPYFVSLDSGLSIKYPNSKYVKNFHEEVQNMKRLAIGAPAPEINLPDTNGKSVTLSSFKGKIVLIDFWASHSDASQMMMPSIVKLYDKYSKKNFTILGVSLDKDKNSWLDGIHRLRMKWTQVSDLKARESSVLALYNFNKLPLLVLVTTDGKIAAKEISDEGLDSEISALLETNKK